MIDLLFLLLKLFLVFFLVVGIVAVFLHGLDKISAGIANVTSAAWWRQRREVRAKADERFTRALAGAGLGYRLYAHFLAAIVYLCLGLMAVTGLALVAGLAFQ